MLASLTSNILLVGSGGLGCELLKCLVMEGFKNVSIVDPDIVVLSNLNRQLLYRPSDVGKFKAEVAYSRIERWIDTAQTKFFSCRIENLDIEEISKYDIIFGALDSIETRRWLNAVVYRIYQLNKDSSKRTPILIDGGSQNLYGHVRIVKPGLTSCIECTLDLFSAAEPLPCTLSSVPKCPEDCINYVMCVEWELLYPNTYPDTKSQSILNWIYLHSLEYGKKYGIDNITLDLVDYVVNNPIPNLATTNSIIASLMVSALFKDDTMNFYFYSGDGATCLSRFNLDADLNCPICQSDAIKLSMNKSKTLLDLLNYISDQLNIKSPSITSNEGVIYMSNPDSTRALYSSRLEQTLGELANLFGTVLFISSANNSRVHVIELNIDS